MLGPRKTLGIPLSSPLNTLGNAWSHLAGQNSWLETTVEQIETTGWAAEIYDDEWRLLWVSEELKEFLGEDSESILGYGEHILSVYQRPLWRDKVSEDNREQVLQQNLPYIAHDTPGQLDALRSTIDPDYVHLLDTVEPIQAPPVWSTDLEFSQADMPAIKVHCMNVRIHDTNEHPVATARIYGPSLKASLLNFVARGDEQMFERMSRLVSPGRRPVAVLFADLEASVRLSRRLPSAAYFHLISALTKAIDDVIVKHSGVVGKHVGDGVSAFFLATDHGATSSAARAAIVASQEIREIVDIVTERIGVETGLTEEMRGCKINIGLHWGDTVFMGQIVSGGRLEVTALGDEVNDCARIQECANGGQILASKALIERLSESDASSLDIEVGSRTYEILNEIDGVSEKTERDGLTIPVTAL